METRSAFYAAGTEFLNVSLDELHSSKV